MRLHRRAIVASVIVGGLALTLLPGLATAAPVNETAPQRPAAAVAPKLAAPKAIAPPGPANYAYDATGRLVGVTQPTGDTARYRYDAAGNNLEIQRYASNQLSVLSVVPVTAAPGAVVTISGTAFATAAASNVVTFNGVAGRVISASATALRVEVPAAATNGPLRVVVNGVTAEGGTFVVAPRAPVITAMSPTSADPNDEVTLTGSGFDPVLGHDVVTVAGQQADVLAATVTTLRFRVPARAQTGRVKALTLRGEATSAQELFIPPPGVDAATVDSVTRLALGTTTTVAVTTPGKVAVVVFDAPARRNVSAGFTNLTFAGDLEATLYGPDGLEVPAGSAAGDEAFDLDVTGLLDRQTHVLVLDPRDAADRGQVAVTLSEPVTGLLSATAPGLTRAVTLPGQDLRLSFDAPAGQAGSLGFTARTFGVAANLAVFNPQGESLLSVASALGWVSEGDEFDLGALAMAGPHEVVVDPQDAKTGSVTTTYSARAEAGVLAKNGAALTATVSRPGQDAGLLFDGIAGEAVAFGFTANTLTTDAPLDIFAPNGTELPDTDSVYAQVSEQDNGQLWISRLPVTGRYRLVIDPQDAGTGATAVTFSTRVNAGVATTTGGAVTARMTRPGQNAAVGVDAAIGQQLSVGLTGNTFPANVELSVLGPDGARFGDDVVVAGGAPGDLDLPKVTVAGRYTVLVSPRAASLGAVAVTVSADVAAGALTVGGPARPAAATRPGQNARFTFTGTAGQLLRLTSAGDTYPDGVIAVLLKADGTEVGRVNVAGTSGGNLPELPSVGTYSLVVDPRDAATGTINIGLATRAAVAPAASTAKRPILHTTTYRPEPKRRPDAQPAALAGKRQLLPTAPFRAEPKRRPAAEQARPETPPAAVAQVEPRSWTPDAASLGGANWLTRRAPVRKPEPLQAGRGVTALSGHLLALDGSPLVGATATIGKNSTRTDKRGRFLLTNVPAGDATLVVDGGPASTAKDRFGVFHLKVTGQKGRTTVLPYTVWMQRLDTEHLKKVSWPNRSETVITTPKIPGLEVRIPAGSVVRDATGKPVTELGITPIPLDRTPFPLPENGIVPVYFTVQPGGSFVFPEGARIVYPNYTKLPAGQQLDFWNYDPKHKGWYVYGKGRVSADARQVVPDAGTKVWAFHGAMFNGSLLPWLTGTFDDAMDWLDGDPVDLSTGRFTDTRTDLVVEDTFPAAVTRSHWGGDDKNREFGFGTMGLYGTFLNSTSDTEYQEVDLYVPGGRKVHFERTSAGTGYEDAVFAARDAAGEYRGAVIRYSADPALGDRRGWALARRDGTVFVFPAYGPVVAIRDRHGNQLTLTRQGLMGAQLMQVTTPNGRWIRFTHDRRAGRYTSATDNLGRTVSYTYDEASNLETVTDPAGKVTRYTYDDRHRVVTVTDARGIKYLTNQYDAAGRVKKQTLTNGMVYEFAYTANAEGRVTETRVTKPDKTVRRVTFNAAGAATSDTDAFTTPFARTTTYERGLNQRIEALTDPLGRKTAFRYDPQDRLQYATEMFGTGQARITGSYAYGGPYDQPLRYTDPDSKATVFTYEPDGDLSTVTDPENRTTRFTYNAAGRLLTVKDPAGKETGYAYRGGDLASVTDPLGRTTKQFTDAAGRVLAITDPAGAVSRLSHDPMNQVTQVTDALGRTTKLKYDENGNLKMLTDPRNFATTWMYDDTDRVHHMMDPLLRGASATYHPSSGRLEATSSRGGRVTRYEPDIYGHTRLLTYRLGAGAEDKVGRSYDNANRLRTVTDVTSGDSTSFDYDPFDRLTTETSPQGTITYTYDKLDRRATMLVAGQPVVTYGYEGDGSLARITQGDKVVEYSYDTAGRESGVKLPGGWSRVTQYDAGDQVSSLTYRHGNVDKGNLTYTYDTAGRVTSVGGSLAQVDLPEARSGLVYNGANRLTEVAGTELRYDDDGNLIKQGNTAYTWNGRGELVSIFAHVGYSFAFDYDPLGRRVERSSLLGSTSVLNDGDMPVREGSGNTTVSHLSGGLDEWFTRTDTAGQRTFLTDRAGSTVALGDATGALKTQYAYDPHGVQTRTGEANGNAFTYTGRERDLSGLMYYRARYYSPDLGRFISEDPIGFAGGTNLYTYAANSPTNYTDPSGNNPMLVGCILGGLTEGAMDWGSQRLAGRKVDWGWGGVGGAAALGCAMGAIGGMGRGTKAVSCAVNSFTPDTMVVMADGSRKRIRDVKRGDRVLASPDSDPNGTPRAGRVSKVIIGDGLKKLVDISVDGGDPITATDGHPFWLPREGRWADAGELLPGTWLRTSAGTYVQVTAVTRRTAQGRVHNLTVDGLHTYFVVAGDDQVLVHNCAGKGTYRSLFQAQNPHMPKDWQVHHALPQKYADTMAQVGVNVHENKFLRGVSAPIHSQITTEWGRFGRSLGRPATADEVTKFSHYIDGKYGQYFIFGH